MSEFVARTQPFKVVLGILIALGFVAIGVMMAGILDQPATPPPGNATDLTIYPLPASTSRYPDWLIVPMGWACIILFGGMAIIGAIRLTNPADHLRINRMGITVPSYSEHPIAWAQIAAITTWSHRGQKSLIIKLHDPSRFERKSWRRSIDSLNRSLTGGDIGLSLTGTDRTLKQALDAIEAFRPKP
ncbi:hypothetical protein GCM10009093_17850 [Brevundimonas terrae]|uniref:PH domain-containing protein n=1 Tax=Brevundimonas terrae TaxID=363631 RepID=A0ABP3I7Q0_9CAUL|nr:STM3941 family protein [Brevundimonas terrae]NIJ26524.1 hypothetical protein [Brevundimonas terrae]